jgi:hypothetical protein
VLSMPHRDGRRERGVELLDGIAGMRELLLDNLPGLGVELLRQPVTPRHSLRFTILVASRQSSTLAAVTAASSPQS